MDSLTAHYIARELDIQWRERRLKGCIFDTEGRRLLLGVEKNWICIDLSLPAVTVKKWSDEKGGGTVEGWTVRRVYAPKDDRRLVFDLARPGRFKGSAERSASLEISAVPNARGAVLRDAGGIVLTRLGAKVPPTSQPRPVLDEKTVSHAASTGDIDTLVGGCWISKTVAQWLIAEPASAAARYLHLTTLPEPEPSRCDGKIFPFPICEGAVSVSSMIESAEETSASPKSSTPSESSISRARRRMQEELTRAQRAPALRQIADALMALGDAPVPATVTLPDGSSAPVEVSAESAVKAAEDLYDTVRSMERALQNLPGRLAALDEREKKAQNAQQQDPKEHARDRHPRVVHAAMPFRTYRSSGGLEIWVGRGAQSNDDLTFHASAPEDVWLHARDVAGAHVILRWQRDEAPPSRDLEEAAMLAAWHSKARGSTVVPVDWTRRKYVRKPRGAAPGSVIVQRGQTVMTRPERSREQKLRADHTD